MWRASVASLADGYIWAALEDGRRAAERPVYRNEWGAYLNE